MSSFTPVKPGDLITAAFLNQVLGAFDDRISKLEASSGIGGGGMLITGLSPAGQLHMGDQLTVLGQNFGLPSQAVVTIDSARVDSSSFLPGSGNNALIFQIPPVQGVPPEGKLVTLMVSNPTSAASFQFTLFPFALTIPTGQLFVNMTGAPSVGTITPNNSYIFIFTVTADTSLADSYQLTGGLDAASKTAGWTAIPVDANSGNPISQVQIPQGQKTATQVGLKVTIPAVAGVATAQVTLTLTSILNPSGLTNSGSTPVNVGAAPPPPNAISINIVGVTATGIPGAGFTGNNAITLPHGTTTGVLAVNALCPSADTYVCTAPTFDAPGWAGNVTPTKQQFPTTGPNQTVLIQINLTAVPAGPASTTLHFKVQSKAQTNIVGQISPTISVS